MINYKFNDIELRPEYQQPIHDITIEHLRNSDKPAFISASVGAGKTVNIGAIAHYVNSKGGRVLVLARTAELVSQNSNMAWKMGVKNSVYCSGLDAKNIFYPVVFGSEKTVFNGLESDFKKHPFNVVLIDESHHCSTHDVLDAINDENYLTGDYSQYSKIIAHFKQLNPKTKIIGYTGSPYRGKEDMLGEFWTKKLYDVSTMWLVSIGYLVPPVFGFGDDNHKYDLSEWTPSQEVNSGNDFSGKDLAAMQTKIVGDDKKTAIIMEEVVAICAKRSGGVMITCAGKKHCEQVAQYLPHGSYAIILGTTGDKDRAQSLRDARTGDIKYVLQVGCLTTGVNVPPWSTSVILRRIGSLTLLTQLIGRILRILEPEDIDRGFEKVDGLVLDYTDTFESFGDIYDDPLLDKARAHKAKKEGVSQECPTCGVLNSEYAVRCIGPADNDEGRCEYFFQAARCFACGTDNAPTARNCRKCNAIMIDPSKALRNKAYTDADYKEVLSMSWEPTKTTNGVKITYHLNSVYTENGIEMQEIANEYFSPFGTKVHQKVLWRDFIKKSIRSTSFARTMQSARTVADIIKNKAMFDVPTHITHRINDKGLSIINRRKFRSGRESQ